jgi:hypothetical protein
MVKHHYVVAKNSDGSVQLQPLKPWLRANTKYIPPAAEGRTEQPPLRQGALDSKFAVIAPFL